MLNRMGCNVKKKINFWSSNAKKIMLAFLISMIWITTLTPMVLAATEASIHVTFDPSGAVIVDVMPKSYAFGSVPANEWKNTTNNYFTLYNNGTVAMTTQIYTNGSTDSAEMNYQAGNPGTDKYAFSTHGFTSNTWIPTAYGGSIQTVNAASNMNFGLDLKLGIINTNFTLQTTNVYIKGTSV
jgi:hypothetical protein